MTLAPTYTCVRFSSGRGVTFVAALLSLASAVLLQDLGDEVDVKESSAQVEVRAVLIKCAQDISDLKDSQELDGESEIKRFEREELFRHDALQNCLKKLALTVRLSSAPGDANSEEYIPIEHVVAGPSRRRVRLLEPYVLRLRRSAPLQAYQLQHVDRVLGVMTKEGKNILKVVDDGNNKNNDLSRQQRDLDHQPEDKEWSNRMESSASVVSLDHEPGHRSFSVRLKEPAVSRNNSSLKNLVKAKACDKRDSCDNSFLERRHRSKRREHNIIIEDNADDDKTPIWMLKDQADSLQTHHGNDDEVKIGGHPKRNNHSSSNTLDGRSSPSTTGKWKPNHNEKQPSDAVTEEDFVLYAIQEPVLWHSVQIQMYKKYNDADGKIVWDDLTKGMTANVGLKSPAWSGEDLSVRYKPLDWVGPEDFALPKKSSLCLLVPQIEERSTRGIAQASAHPRLESLGPEQRRSAGDSAERLTGVPYPAAPLASSLADRAGGKGRRQPTCSYWKFWPYFHSYIGRDSTWTSRYYSASYQHWFSCCKVQSRGKGLRSRNIWADQ